MNTNDFSAFHLAWINSHAMSVSNHVPNDSVVMAVFDVLNDYPLNQVLYGIQQHVKASKFPPTPADIIEIIGNYTKSKHIGAEEAWAIALRSFDESLPIVLTKEILEAKATVQDIYDSGDSVGTRMAFREVYNRILLTAKDVKWFVTQGDDKSLTESVVKQAVELGRLPQGSESKYRIEAPTTTSQALIEQAHKRTGKVDAMANIKMIKSLLTEIEDDGIATREAERLEFEAHRNAMIDRALIVQQGELH